MSRVNVIPIADAVYIHIQSGNNWSTICRKLGWIDNRNKPDTSRLQRTLGLRDTSPGVNSHPKSYKYRCRMIDEDTALRIIKAIGRQPVEFGL